MPQQIIHQGPRRELNPNQSLRNRYYKECFEAGVSKNDAVDVEVEFKQKFTDWWIGKRFNKSEPALIEDEDDAFMSSIQSQQDTVATCEKDVAMNIQYPYFCPKEPNLKSIKASLVTILKEDGDIKPQHNPRFLSILRLLELKYKSRNIDARYENVCQDATWFTFSVSGYQESLGKNSKGNHKYTLGRMSFDMFKPTNLICSVQWTFNTVMSLNGQKYDQSARPIPNSIRQGLFLGKENQIRQYDISTAFTVEQENFFPGSQQDTTPLRGLMSTFGYIIPHPKCPNRFLVLFTGGLLEEVLSKDHSTRPSLRWKRIFSDSQGRTLKSRAQLVAARLMLGAEVSDRMDETDGSMEYFFHRPIGGDGKQFIDVLYLDDDFRIMRGHHGTIYVSTRMREYKSYH